ncbi:hypothetical protein G6F57_010044 [Rhizopus arrhizus]|uniref:Uncharacterized protein n=1 Tax=Rhizopus oryzae TaxID=64495 RepID=A0A9P6X2G9_RHIOR|nr:hypothetical protein G6F23_005955 [Rhizopus arrhizus]KAG1414061.1 hypothetical protein G6F58_007153 [Rhizopus delemar]KAG0758267.1 hypothetical protein G6F24_009911 [Rhizopus arrhizus]KAG0781676.1 hypothetical protein G6F21_011519 [Rhizopus arrhizus]KAG0781967.1 hypothetical protein G6F22_009324 [Rhizopus arrhizus]
MGTPDNGKHTVAESPEINIVNKRTRHEEVLVYGEIDDTIKTLLSGKTGIFQESDHLEVGIGVIVSDGRNRCTRDDRNGLGL